MTDRAPSGLEIEGLTVAYDERVVLADASLSCRRGEVVGLLGPNGSGKSSLLKGVLGLAPRVAGRVKLDGAPLDRRRRARVAYTPQRGEVDWGFPITVEEVVLLGRQAHLGLFGRPGRADRALAAAALERLGMLAQRRAQIGELSGGQQQRVFLARALAQGGGALLLDEPLTGVDAQTQSVVLALLEELRRDGQAIVVATHDLPEAAALCDRLCMLNGRVVAFGPPGDVLSREVLAETYGGTGLIELPRRDGAIEVLADLPVALPHGAGPACDR
ncbi:MAG TPA: metal ABC transporter ATP-binding protein [Chloroflexota bacterium]